MSESRKVPYSLFSPTVSCSTTVCAGRVQAACHDNECRSYGPDAARYFIQFLRASPRAAAAVSAA